MHTRIYVRVVGLHRFQIYQYLYSQVQVLILIPGSTPQCAQFVLIKIIIYWTSAQKTLIVDTTCQQYHSDTTKSAGIGPILIPMPVLGNIIQANIHYYGESLELYYIRILIICYVDKKFTSFRLRHRSRPRFKSRGFCWQNIG